MNRRSESERPKGPPAARAGREAAEFGSNLADLLEQPDRLAPRSAADLDVVGVASAVRWVEPGFVVGFSDAEPASRAAVEQAHARGAVAVLAEPQQDVGSRLPVAYVESIRTAVGVAARRLAGCPDRELCVTAVTGTNGKTTTVHLLGALLGRLGGCGRIGTLGIFDGASSSITGKTSPPPGMMYDALRRMVAHGCRYAAMEASSHGLTFGRLHGLELRYAIFTNLSQDHLDFHADMAAYLAAKQTLFAMLPADGVAILNMDDAAGREMPVPRGRRLGYGLAADAALRVEVLDMHPHGTDVRVHWRGEHARTRLPTLGLHNVHNAAAALAVLLLEGVALDEAATWLEAIELPPGRMQRIAGPDFDVIVDYAHSPDALDKVLSACRKLSTGTLRLVFGAGGNKDEAKRPQMGAVASRLADRVYLTSDNPRDEDPEAIIDMIAAGMSGEAVRIADRRLAIAAALTDAGPGDLVVITGKGHETHQEIAGVLHPFDDRAVVRELLLDHARA